jgi:ABC-type polar amino acid transport system ATPase subunit
MQFARDVAQRLVFMDGGKIVEENEPKDFFARPKTERLQAFLRRFNEGYRL